MGLLSGSSQLTTGRLPAEKALLHRIPYHGGSGAVLAGTAGHSRPRFSCKWGLSGVSLMPARARACSTCCTRLVPVGCCLLSKQTTSLAGLGVCGEGWSGSGASLPLRPPDDLQPTALSVLGRKRDFGSLGGRARKQACRRLDIDGRDRDEKRPLTVASETKAATRRRRYGADSVGVIECALRRWYARVALVAPLIEPGGTQTAKT
jgi:hypothetical protein